MTISYKRLLAFLAVGLLFALGARPVVGQSVPVDGLTPEQIAILESLGIEYDAEIFGTPTISYSQYREIMDNGGLNYWAGGINQTAAQADNNAAVSNENEVEMVSVSIRLDKPPMDVKFRRDLELHMTQQGLYKMDFINSRDARSREVRQLVESLGGTYVAEIRYLMSAILAEVPASAIPALEAHRHVVAVNQVADVERNLATTVPFIGAAALQLAGLDGTGVKVGILDSGIDYTHAAFGGPGTVDFYEDKAYYGPATVCPTGKEAACYFNQNPTALGLGSLFGPLSVTRIRGGYDFVGENWPTFSSVLQPDPNPIDFEGHGTHVADIIGGNDGVAPGVGLYSYKVCSAVSSSCSGLAILQGLTQAYIDGMDIVNLSLGAVYGQPNDDATFLVNQMAANGVLPVISAGNSGDSPFIVGSPSSASGAISVAQLTLPTSVLPILSVQNTVGPAIPVTFTNVAYQTWSPLPVSAFTSPLIYGNGNNTNLNGCVPFTADLTDKIVLVDRGGCPFSVKAANASAANADAALIALVAAGDPFEGGYGGGTVTIPTFMITQANATNIKMRLSDGSNPIMTIDPSVFVNNAYAVVGSSSRGPRNHDNFLKPEIGAPGASTSAIAGSGNGIGPFGGTSGAAPMVSGAAALLIQHFNINLGKDFSPTEIKALMMNHANPNIALNQLTGELAPVSRIGGGQVSVGNAANWKLLAYDMTAGVDPLMRTGGLSLGYVTVSEDTVITRTLRVENISSSPVTVEPVPTFRYLSDATSGALTPSVSPALASIPVGGFQDFTFTFTFDAAALQAGFEPANFPGRGLQGNATGGPALTTYELDGYVELRDGSSNVLATVPWHVMPKAATEISVTNNGVTGGVGNFVLTNDSPEVNAGLSYYRLYEENPSWGLQVANCASMGLAPGCNYEGSDIYHVGYADSPDFYGIDDGLMLFLISVHDVPYRAGQFPGAFEIYIDGNRDGTADQVIVNNDLGLLSGSGGIDGRNAVAVFNLSSGLGDIFFLSNSSFNSNVWVLPAANIGGAYDMNLTRGQLFDFWVAAFDNYGGGYWDCAPHVPGLVRPFEDGETTCASEGVFTATFGEWVFEPDASSSTPAANGGTASINYTIGQLGGSDLGILVHNRWAHPGEETFALLSNINDFLTEKVFLPFVSTTP